MNDFYLLTKCFIHAILINFTAIVPLPRAPRRATPRGRPPRARPSIWCAADFSLSAMFRREWDMPAVGPVT